MATSENRGVQTEWPSHPELWNWMAAEFMESNWNVKSLIKMMVMSDAYQSDSEVTPEKLEKDPENRLLARRHRFPSGGGDCQ